jgi:hypothetical protein
MKTFELIETHHVTYRMYKIRENCYIPEFLLNVCCDQDCNGEHQLLKTILDKSEPTSVIFDIGATKSKFPSFSTTHEFHLFDPSFEHEPTVDYSRCKVNTRAINSTDYTLDAYCEQNNISHIEFLKIDTDGHDLDVLRGASNILKNTKYIQIEYDIFHLFKKIKTSDLYELLKGFLIYKITATGLKKVDAINEDYIYSNYLFTRHEFSMEPLQLDCSFFTRMFGDVPPESVKYAFENSREPFGDGDCSININVALQNYFSGYMKNFISGLPLDTITRL